MMQVFVVTSSHARIHTVVHTWKRSLIQRSWFRTSSIILIYKVIEIHGNMFYQSMRFDFGGVLDYINVRRMEIISNFAKNLLCINEGNFKFLYNFRKVAKFTGKKTFYLNFLKSF